MNNTISRSSIHGQWRWYTALPPLLALMTLIGILLVYVTPEEETMSLDEDLCPSGANEISGRVALLLDFTKPLSTSQAMLPIDLLRDVGLFMERHSELKVFSLADSPGAPHTLLGRFCKPYANSDLQVEGAKDQSAGLRDCDDLPAQLPTEIRASAEAFCALKGELTMKLHGLADPEGAQEEAVENSYLVEALEEIRLEFAEHPAPHTLYLFSDMMQHADWYSHLDQEWTHWSYDEFAELMAAQNWSLGRNGEGMQVEVFYLPRAGWTDRPRVRETHQQFWRQYFAGSQIEFHNQSLAPELTAKPLMKVLSEAEVAAQERLKVEQMLQAVREEQESLDRERLDMQRRLQEEQHKLQQERDRLRAEEEARQLARREAAEMERQAALARPPEESEEQAQPTIVAAEGSQGEGEWEARPAAPEREVAESVAATEPQPQPQEQVAAGGQRGEPIDEAVVETPQQCRLAMSPRVTKLGPDYPRGGRMNFGEAQITVLLDVDEQGETIDERVRVLDDQSSAVKSRYYDLFVSEALATVRNWSFTFVDPPGTNCIRRQTRTTKFDFSYDAR